MQFNEVLRRMLDRWVTDLIENTRRQISDTCSRTPGEDLGRLARVARATTTLDDIRACPRRLAGLSPDIESERLQTKQFLHDNLYFSPALEPEKEAAERIITDLFELWMAHPDKLPRSYQEKAKAESEPLARVVCDYIAGMTDPYIFEQYEKHCG